MLFIQQISFHPRCVTWPPTELRVSGLACGPEAFIGVALACVKLICFTDYDRYA